MKIPKKGNSVFAFSMIKAYPAGTVAMPVRGTLGSAGLDFKCPKMSVYFRGRLYELNPTDSYKMVKEGIYIPPKKRVLIPTGLRSRLPVGTALIGFEKSGLASKNGIVPTCRVVDEDYQGEICVGIMNTGNTGYTVEFGKKIAQYVLMPVIPDMPEQLDDDKIFEGADSLRKSGGFGSTGL